jgi:hypothetical protein
VQGRRRSEGAPADAQQFYHQQLPTESQRSVSVDPELRTRSDAQGLRRQQPRLQDRQAPGSLRVQPHPDPAQDHRAGLEVCQGKQHHQPATCLRRPGPHRILHSHSPESQNLRLLQEPQADDPSHKGVLRNLQNLPHSALPLNLADRSKTESTKRILLQERKAPTSAADLQADEPQHKD